VPKSLLTVLLFVPFFSLACASTQPDTAPPSAHIVCVVPGVSGDLGGYNSLKSALAETGATDLREFRWGSAFFVLNFQSTSIHETAEKELAERITDWLRQKPDCKIDLIGHSAGGGVILGALGRLDEKLKVDHVVLLAPSVSPGYNLVPPLNHITTRLDLFYSSEDVVFLKWRTGTFGTYDNIRTAAAGHLGFAPNPPLPPDLATKLVQRPYDPKWRELGNDGSHLGPTSHDFVRDVVAPLLSARRTAALPPASAGPPLR
jgi:pimeloyl-ACP methyl ester carboxylesterase